MLLGKSLGWDVCRVDFTTAVSKYIGETERNIDAILNEAEKDKLILLQATCYYPIRVAVPQ